MNSPNDLHTHRTRVPIETIAAHSNKWRRAADRGSSIGRLLIVPVVLCALLGPPTRLWAKAAAPPMRVSVSDLAREPQQYDKQRVLVSGVVRAMVFQRGRRGSEYVLMTLEELRGALQEPPPSVNVVTADLPRVKVGEQILVRGVYYVAGMEAGRSYDHFIDAEEIRRERAA